MNLQLFNISPTLPGALKFLEVLADNMWWCWHSNAIELFVRINPNLWRELNGNAKAFLSKVSMVRMNEIAQDTSYIRHLKLVESEFRRRIPETDDPQKRHIAYFSMEFGIHESVRIYSGGLGVLAGDHLKSASDMNLPLIGVGLLYRQGYFRQMLDRNGWQIERYPDNQVNYMPLSRVRDANGNEINITIPIINRILHVAIWKLNVGNIPLILLDTEIPQNPPEFREITWRLYGGDKKMRIQQEILLGVGGYKALLALGYAPEVCHMNEGHAAFLSLARIDDMVNNRHFDPEVALETVWRTNVFTTHTPVPAGNEVFSKDMVRPYLEPFCQSMHINVERVMNWGVPVLERPNSGEMSMTVLGLRLANSSNAVSKLHGEVARNMWKHLWPGRAVDESPINHITNGVHVRSWVAPRKKVLFERYLPANWHVHPNSDQLHEALDMMPDEELWVTHELCRQHMVRKVRRLMQDKIKFGNSSKSYSYKNFLDPDALTIGFARRFATYKRGTILLRNPKRLLKMLQDTTRPIQFVFAGKAHPADEAGKRLIQELIQFAEQNNVQNKLVFLEDYDIGIARTLVQGVDVWLNTPRRPQEASGTSGMKATINGVINCSILDGWWAEGYTPECGWAIAGNQTYEDPEDCDNYESQVLFDILESEIIPCFYDRNNGDYPRRWVEKMKGAIACGLSQFSSQRMVGEYRDKFYLPALKAHDELIADDAAYAKALVAQKAKFAENFVKMTIEPPQVGCNLCHMHVGDMVKISTNVYLAGVDPSEVEVQIYYGTVNTYNEIISCMTAVMEIDQDFGNGYYSYSGKFVCRDAGRIGLTCRIVSVGDAWKNSVPGFICWPK